MNGLFKDANEITIEDLENFLNGDGAATSTANDEGSSSATQPNTNGDVIEGNTEDNNTTNVTETQAFARRLKEATTKARNEERESIAKSLGYENFAAMQRSREEDMLKEKGLDPEDVSPVVEQLVKKRLAEDPLMQELEAYRNERLQAWAQKELTELSELTDGKISKMEDIPKDVLELWKTKGSLKKAYIELQGEKLIKDMRTGITSGQSRGSTGHLSTPKGSPSASSDKRPLTQKEKEVYKLFNPSVTDEELSKMTKDK